MVGFQLMICNENVGATNLRMFCSRNADDYKTSHTWNENEYRPCNWGPVRYCPITFAICWFQYEYEREQGQFGDDSGITNMKMVCCVVYIVLMHR